MTDYHYSWTIKAPVNEHASLRDTISSALCESMGFCLAAGCGCVIEGNEEVCSEEALTGVKRNSGPHWNIVCVTIGDGLLKVDMYVSGPVYSHEIEAATRALKKVNRPVYPAKAGVNF